MIVPRSLFQLDINLMLVSFDEQRVPSLQRPYLCCRPTLSINKLCQYVAFQTSLQANEVEIYLVREINSKVDFSISMSTPISKPGIIDPCKDKLQVLEEQETLGRLKTRNFIHGHLLLAYRKKVWKSES
ncbi:hypothetical protein POTOM_015118 [Populus tomentosa]|uniref:Uncharacterized protein n=1 Tax=Populus tomentosa TaxID=118781 RepID=A0A8X8A2H8_POPTO|nr:hypothetical protein POTOM_015118 [Populus tomentosa]